MSDRLALADAIEDAGISREKATRIASVIFDAIHQNVATKADVQASAAEVRADFAELRGDTRTEFSGLRTEFATFRGEVRSDLARMDGRIERQTTAMREMENRLLRRLGAIGLGVGTLLFAALHIWPPH